MSIEYTCPRGCCEVYARVDRNGPRRALSWLVRVNDGAPVTTALLAEHLRMSTVAVTKRLGRRACLVHVEEHRRRPRRTTNMAVRALDAATRFAMLRWPGPERVAVPR